MKKKMKIIALVLAFGATVQALKAYAVEAQVFSVEEEEYKVERLMEMRKQITVQGNALTVDADFSAEFSNVKSSTDLNVSLVKHLVRYIFAIGAEKSLFEYLKGADVQAACAAAVARCGSEPGI